MDSPRNTRCRHLPRLIHCALAHASLTVGHATVVAPRNLGSAQSPMLLIAALLVAVLAVAAVAVLRCCLLLLLLLHWGWI